MQRAGPVARARGPSARAKRGATLSCGAAEVRGRTRPTAEGEGPGEHSERMRRVKEAAVRMWRSQGKVAKGDEARAREADFDLQRRSLLNARCEFMEEKILKQEERILQLSSALAVAKDALASAMHCLAHGDGEVVALPDVKRYIPVDQLRGEGEEEEELCDVESFSNIESALHQVRLTKDECL